MIASHALLPSMVRGVDLLGLVLLAGGLTFRMLVVFPGGRGEFPVGRFLPFFLLLIGLGDLVLRSQTMSGRPFGEVWAFLPIVLLKSHFGKVWIVRTFLLCVLCGISIIKMPDRVRGGIALIASAFLLLTTSLSGHAANSGDLSLSVLSDWLHLVAVSAWTGGLFSLALVLRKRISSLGPERSLPALITLVGRFSTLAGVCVVSTLLTGSYQAWYQVRNLSALLQTPYGRMLIAKLLLVSFLFGLGALNRYRILPKLYHNTQAGTGALIADAPRTLLATVTLEIGLLLAILACVAVLTQLPPARSEWGSLYKAARAPINHLGEGRSLEGFNLQGDQTYSSTPPKEESSGAHLKTRG